MTGANEPESILLSWSSGKDSAWALHRLREDAGVEVVGLLTTVNRDASRVAMHAVREQLLHAQAAAAGIELTTIGIPDPCPNEVYEAAMSRAMDEARARGVTAVAFGDLYLEDIRAYRESKLEDTGIRPVFPLFGADTAALAEQMIAAGLGAWVTCVDPGQLDAGFVGRHYDQSFLDDLPAGVDPCGENGEFHTFCYRGPMFSRPVPVVPGRVVERGGFVFADLTLAS